MTTPLVPDLPELPAHAGPDPAHADPDPAGPTPTAPPAARRSGSTVELVATVALLLLVALALVLAAVVRTVPVGSLVTVAALLLVAIGVLAVGTRPDDDLRVPAGHAGTHVDRRAVQALRDAPADGAGDAGAYYYDEQGRPKPIEDAF